MTSDISDLVEAAREGNKVAFEELVRITHTETYTLALRLTNHPDDAADVTQEAYLRAYRSLDRFRGDAQFTTWLYRITANCASTHLSKRKRHRYDPLDEQLMLADDAEKRPEMKADIAVDRASLTSALSKLPHNLRVVVVLRDIYDMPHQAIAKELGISEVTAKVRLHRARKRLRDQLSKDIEEVGVHAV